MYICIYVYGIVGSELPHLLLVILIINMNLGIMHGIAWSLFLQHKKCAQDDFLEIYYWTDSLVAPILS